MSDNTLEVIDQKIRELLKELHKTPNEPFEDDSVSEQYDDEKDKNDNKGERPPMLEINTQKDNADEEEY